MLEFPHNAHGSRVLVVLGGCVFMWNMDSRSKRPFNKGCLHVEKEHKSRNILFHLWENCNSSLFLICCGYWNHGGRCSFSTLSFLLPCRADMEGPICHCKSSPSGLTIEVAHYHLKFWILFFETSPSILIILVVPGSPFLLWRLKVDNLKNLTSLVMGCGYKTFWTTKFRVHNKGVSNSTQH